MFNEVFVVYDVVEVVFKRGDVIGFLLDEILVGLIFGEIIGEVLDDFLVVLVLFLLLM